MNFSKFQKKRIEFETFQKKNRIENSKIKNRNLKIPKKE